MDNANRWNRDVLTALGSLRPNSADEQLPEAAAVLRAMPEADRPSITDLQARNARFDKAVSVSLVAGSPPVGLADRILESLRLQGQAGLPGQNAHGALADVPSPDIAAISPAPRTSVPSARISSRRRLLAAAAGFAALAASLTGVAVWFRQPAAVLKPDAVLESAREFAGAGDESPWQAITASKPPRAYPISAALSIDPTATRWRTVERFLGRSGVAYDLTSLAGARATLLVVSLDSGPQIEDLPGNPGGKPLRTAGTATVAWQSNARLYVLVVHGGQQEYRSFFRGAGLA